MSREIVSMVMSALLIWTSGASVLGQTSSRPSLQELVFRPYLELLETADQLRIPSRAMEDFRNQLKREEESEEKRLKKEEDVLKMQINALRRQLDELNKRASSDTSSMAEQRRDLHCRIVTLEGDQRAKETERKTGLPIAYDNQRAKLDVIEKWPAEKRQILAAVASGSARQRQHGDVEDIGIRIIQAGQEKDVKVGEDAIREMKAYGLIPPEVENPELKTYVQKLADKIAVHSDLKVPLKMTVLDSPEINAFALPGGYLYINTGLIERAENESELAGVIAHEIAHVTARHGNRLMKKANIAGIIFQAAQVAAMIFTGGAVGIGTYYALQYGFFGLGLVLNLTLLGVSRDFEQEADQLGVQYAWNAGYDPKGFISFFDKMASEKGYVRSASFFRTHPPFFERMVSSFGEIEYLPPKEDVVVDTNEFQEAKVLLEKMKAESKKEPKKNRPSLKRLPQCDEQEQASSSGGMTTPWNALVLSH